MESEYTLNQIEDAVDQYVQTWTRDELEIFAYEHLLDKLINVRLGFKINVTETTKRTSVGIRFPTYVRHTLTDKLRKRVLTQIEGNVSNETRRTTWWFLREFELHRFCRRFRRSITLFLRTPRLDVHYTSIQQASV